MVPAAFMGVCCYSVISLHPDSWSFTSPFLVLLPTHYLFFHSMLIFFPSFLLLWSLSLQHTPLLSLSTDQGCNNRRSAFQWKPLINTNLHLKCNLILTTYALSVNWISHLKDKRGWGWCYGNIPRQDVAGQPWPPSPNSSFTFSAQGLTNSTKFKSQKVHRAVCKGTLF